MSHPEFDTVGKPSFLTPQRLRRFALDLLWWQGSGPGCSPATTINHLTSRVAARSPGRSVPKRENTRLENWDNS